MFIWGLQQEIGGKVRIFNPKTLYDAYLVANMQEATNDLLRESCNKIVAGKSEQKREIGNDIEDEEVIELNDASGVIDISIGLMGIRLMDCGFNGNGKLCGIGGLELPDRFIVECLGGMERETCDKMRNSVKKDGSGVREMEFIAGDIIKEEGFEEDRKNGKNSFSNIVGKKKEYGVEQHERTKENDNFVVWDSQLLDKTDDPSVISDCLATLKSEKILVKSDWKKLVFEENGNCYGIYSNSSKA
nr:hypothetical protein [Tanacetum cinerariifolium]